MSQCKHCDNGDPAIGVKCAWCGAPFHIHQCQIAIAEVGTLVVSRCPRCQLPNCWLRTNEGIRYAGGTVVAVENDHGNEEANAEEEQRKERRRWGSPTPN